MNGPSQIILYLPDENEIVSSAERRDPLYPHLIRKRIRYRNGVIVVFYQDLIGNIFDIAINSSDCPFWSLNNRVFRQIPYKSQ